MEVSPSEYTFSMDLQQPDWLALGAVALISVMGIATMLALYRRLDNAFARMAVQ